MRHVVQLFAVLSALRIARDNIFWNPLEFFESETDESLGIMNRLDLQNDLLPQLTFSSLKFFCR
jgi:hypothetical protein